MSRKELHSQRRKLRKGKRPSRKRALHRETCPRECQPGKINDLLKDRERLRSIFAASPDAISVTDLNGKIIECNKATVKLYGGASKQELLNKNALEFIVKRDRPRAVENLKRALEKGSVKNVEYSLVTKNGGEYPIELSANVVLDRSGKPTAFVGILKDISERKRAERALVESEKRYRTVVDNIAIGVSVISPKMEILSLNDQMRRWFPGVDVSKRPICYKTFNNPPRRRICSYCPTCKTLKDGQVHESITETPSGNRIVNYRIVASPIKDKEGKILAAIEMVDDITERKQMEEQLKRYSEHLEELVKERTRELEEEEERFRSVVDYASEAIITIDSKTNILFWNKAAEKIFGYTTNEAVGKPISLVIPRWARKNHRKKVNRVIVEEGKGSTGKLFELAGLKKDGSEFPVELSFSVWKTSGGVFSTSVIRDITERKKMEDRLSALNLHASKLNVAESLQQVYELTLDAIEKTLGFEHAALMTVEREHLVPVCQRGYAASLAFELPLDGKRKGITVRAATQRRPIFIHDVTQDKEYFEGFGGIKSELAVPILAGEKVRGVINVESKNLAAFADKDAMLLEILASHVATAIENLMQRSEINKRNAQQASLMECSAEMIRSTELRQRLQAIMNAIKGLGWQRVVLSVRDEDLEIEKPDDIVTAGLTEGEQQFLWDNRPPGQVWKERFGPDYERFGIGEFYYLPWSDPFVRKRFSEGIVASHLKLGDMVDWHPEDLLYAPLRLADGRIIGVVSMDDPVDGKRPTKASLAPLELFLPQAAVAIENARLIEELDTARTQIQEYANQLEDKVCERTEELVATQQKLLKAERLAVVGELAGMVGHDLRNPLTGIAGAAYYLKSKLSSKTNRGLRRMLSVIEEGVEHSNRIINDLLEYSREIKLELVETKPKALLDDILSFIIIPKRIRVVNEVKNDPGIMVDKERMRRVFANIIKNALDAMSNGGKLVIKSKTVSSGVIFSFSDTGMGMTKETISKLWTPLFTTKAKGMGFGLAICKRIVEAHGGTIGVESRVGKGSIFTVKLPKEPKTAQTSQFIWVGQPEPITQAVKI